MSKVFAVCGFICLSLAFPSPGEAIFGFGAHGGMDFYSVDPDSLTFQLGYDLQGRKAKASLVREEIDSPVLVGGRFYVDVVPIIDVEISADVALRKYSFTFTREIAGGIETRDDETTFGRVALYATVRKDMLALPPIVHIVAAYVGAGIGLHFATPVLTPQLFIDELASADTQLDIDEFVKRGTKIGGHALVGVRVKPPMFPLVADAEAQYNVVPKGDYEEPNAFPSVRVGLWLDF